LEEAKQSPGVWILINKLNPLSFFELNEFGFDSKTSDKDELQIGQFFHQLPRNMKNYYLENFKNKFYKDVPSAAPMSQDLAILQAQKDLILRNLLYYGHQNTPERERETNNLIDEIMKLKSDRSIEIFKVKYKFPFSFCMQEIVKVKRLKRKSIDEAVRTVVGMNKNILQT
jgi:hypothetical protein